MQCDKIVLEVLMTKISYFGWVSQSVGRSCPIIVHLLIKMTLWCQKYHVLGPEDPFQMMHPPFGHLGSKRLSGLFGALIQRKTVQVQMAIFLFFGGMV